MIEFKKIDLHMHSTESDGTDTPEEIIERVRTAGIQLFALTDHDAVSGCIRIRAALKGKGINKPKFINGVEFSTKDEDGKYHILGYGYDLSSAAIIEMVDKAHGLRMDKVYGRLDFLESRFGFTFKEEDLKELLSLNNPGKPHIANLMVKYGYAESKEDGIDNYINKLRLPNEYLNPKEAIESIVVSGGIPVLAHPAYGSGEELILGSDLEERIKKLMNYGLQGVEAYYSGFTPKISGELLEYADKYDLFVTAGSDYHGKNKLVELGDIGLSDDGDPAAAYKKMPGLIKFFETITDGIEQA